MDAENVIAIVAQAILVLELALKDVVTDALILVVVAPIAVQVVIALALVAAKKLVLQPVQNSVQELALWDALVTVIMVVLVKK